jgi:transposase
VTLRRLAVRRVAIERGDGPIVEQLLAERFEVVVLSPRQVRSLRARYGMAGNNDDRLDAFVLADAARTDAGRWKPVQPDFPATVALRMQVRTRRDLVAHRIAVHNQLLAVLQQHFPNAVGLFSGLDIPISLAFLGRFPIQADAAWLTEARMAAWLQANGYCGRHSARQLLDHLHEAAHARPPAPAAAASQLIVGTLVELLTQLRVQTTALEARIQEALLAHPDGPVFASLPRAGTIRAATCWPSWGTAAPATPTRPRSPPPPASCPQPGNPAVPARHLPPRLQPAPPRRVGRLGPRHSTSQPLGP